VPDLPFSLADKELEGRLGDAVDRDGKVTRAVIELGELAGRTVLLEGAADGRRARELAAAGANVQPMGPGGVGDPDGKDIDRWVSFWGSLRPDSADAEDQLAALEHLVGPDGRLIVVEDYGRDDVVSLLGGPDRESELVAWSNRKGWFLARGFRIRVIHSWWTFESLEEAADLLGQAFAQAGQQVAEGLRRPRLAHKVAVFHRGVGPAGQ
jgi:hypothetical protein